MGSECSTAPRWQAAGAVVLSAVGFATSGYLTNLYVEATEAMKDAGKVDSFCNISKGMNCEAVAASEYSAFLGVPISVYGLQFFALAIALVLASRFKWMPLKKWDSLLFALTGIGVPVTAVLGWVSVSLIKSVCIMCMLVYAVNSFMFLMFAIPNRRRLGSLLTEGPRELWAYATEGKHRPVTLIAVLLVASQFYWVPRVMGREAHAANAQRPPTSVTEAKPGIWLGQSAVGNTLGPVEAPIQIEEFTDFQCPFCGRAHQVLLEVVKKYPGQIRLVHRDFPLDHNCNPSIAERFHPDACRAAYFAHCAAEQDLYWPFESMLFHNQRNLNNDAMVSFAEKVGLDTDKMALCIEAESTHQAVLADIKEGLKRGIAGTPTLFINGETVVGARPMKFWDEKIQSMLAGPVGASSASAASAPPTTSAAAAPSVSAPGAASVQPKQ